ncbi:hypothetical protein ABMA57_14605 [Saccharospirillum sp. HFRX-1]|uniref:hypothetical protein n=1 Tax=unclassified Saccharospirillum TaxID=2633430 RepID=UPI003714A927
MTNNNFILSSISTMLEDAASATNSTSDGIETFPLCDYIMQSVFLKMTGALEQKMKSITWEMATNNYEYRYKRYSKKPLGECSSYQEKTSVYKDLIDQIEKVKNRSFNPSSINKSKILSDTTMQVENSFFNSNLMIWAQRSFNDYRAIWSLVSEVFFIKDKSNLFTDKSQLPSPVSNRNSLVDMYTKHLYRHRNKIAHNTLSYQQNLPTLNTLVDIDYKYDNYFVYFSILILIDEIFITLFNEYLNSLENY